MNIFQLNFCSLSRLRKVTWAGANLEDCERMTRFRVLTKKLDIPKIDGFKLQYMFMKVNRSPDTTSNQSVCDSDYSSDTSSGSSGDDSDFFEEEPASSNSSGDSSRTIGYTPPQSDLEANSPGSTQDMAIVIDDEEVDSPLCSPGQNMDVIDLTEDIDMEPTSQSETLFQPESSNFEERRKRKANDIDTYHHPLIEFEATCKLLFYLSFLILGLFQCIAVHQIKLLFHNT